MKNERHQPNNPTETRTIQSRTQIAKLHSHLASNDSTGYRNPKSLSTAAAKIPRRSGSPKGSGEVLERDRGSKSPVSFQPPPRGINKIYKSDVVFPMEESKTNDISQTQLPYTPPRGINKIYKSDVVFSMEESKTNDISKTQFPYTPPRGANKIYRSDAVFPIGEARKKIPKPPAVSLYAPRKNAIAPRRVRMTASAARERSSQGTDQSRLRSTRTCTNSTYIHPSIKVLRSFFKSDRSPVSPFPPFPKSLVVAKREEMPKQIAEGEAEGAESHPAEPFFVTDAGCNGGIAVFGAVGVAAIEVDAFGIGSCGGAAIGAGLQMAAHHSGGFRRQRTIGELRQKVANYGTVFHIVISNTRAKDGLPAGGKQETDFRVEKRRISGLTDPILSQWCGTCRRRCGGRGDSG